MVSNPLIKLEFLRRFRSVSAAWAIPLMLLLPGAAVTIAYWTTTVGRSSDVMAGGEIMFAGGGFDDPMAFDRGGGIAIDQLQSIGIGMFVAVLVTMLIALLLVVPSMVGGSIAGERHNQTLQPLQLTAMTPTEIVGGKMVSSVAYLVVLLLCAAPVMAIPFLLGGTTAGQVIGAYGVLVLIAIEFAAVSLAVSSFMARPAPAIMVSLVLCAALVAVPWIAMTVAMTVQVQGDPNFAAELSRARYLASPSPIALGSWIDFGEDGDGFIRTSDRVLSAFWYLAVIAASLVFARNRVVAPVERDR